jgi:hypothetical protein
MTTIHYMSLGYDCSPAATLRNLNIRDEALPFDWVVSNLKIIRDCIEDNFAGYHCQLQFNAVRSRLVDKYGFQFPHDYPFNDNAYEETHIGEGVFGEEVQKKIINNWADYHPVALEKYARRIERLYNYLRDDSPIIFLCRGYDVPSIMAFANYILVKFNKSNIYFVVSAKYKYISQQIITCDTEANGIWNESSIWQEAIDAIKNANKL